MRDDVDDLCSTVVSNLIIYRNIPENFGLEWVQIQCK